MSRGYLTSMIVTLGLSCILRAQTPGDTMIEKFLARETDRLNQRYLDGATTLEEWQKVRPRLKQEYLDMLGLWPLPEKTPLKAAITGTVNRDDVIIDLLHYQSRPGLYVTGNLYRPKNAKGKLPAVLYVCGHSGRGRDGNKTAFQDHGMWFASNGYVCLVIDTLQLGEVAGIHHGTYREKRWWWQSLGYTSAGVECWNGIRGIDYLVSRDDVDAEKIAVTGISGGGAATIWITAADDRVKCAVPVSGMSDLESYIKNKVVNGHCDCMFLVNSYAWEWTTIAAMIAPRPMLFANSDNDRIFPMDGNRRIIDRLRKLYKLYDKPNLVDDFVSMGGHDYRPDLRIAIFKWINKHIKNDKGEVKDAAFKELPGKELRVFEDELPGDQINDRVDEDFVRAAKVNVPKPEEYERWRKTMLRLLKMRTFRRFPDRIPALKEDAGRYSSEPDIEVALSGDLCGKPKEGGAGLLIVLNPGDEFNPKESPFWSRIFEEGGPVHVLKPRSGWTTKNPPNYVERSHALLGQTVDEGRVWDIAATLRYLSEKDNGKTKWKVVGRRESGILAAYAALFEPIVEEVIAVDPPPTHRYGPTLLNVLRTLDIPEALGMLAPRSLTLVNSEDKMLKRVAEFYSAADATKKLRHRSIAFR